MKALGHHLYLRGRYFYYRISLPRPLHTALECKEVVIALSTQDVALGRLYVAKLDIEIQSLIEKTYTGLNKACSMQDIEAAQTLFKQGIEEAKNKIGLPQKQQFNLELLSSQTQGSPKLFSQVAKEYLKDCVTNAWRLLIPEPFYHRISIQKRYGGRF